MAHKTENEETEYKVVPEATTITLCVKCGVATASTSSSNLCQKCTPLLAEKPFRSVQPTTIRSRNSSPAGLTSRDLKKDAADPVGPGKREVNRCSGCRRRVGLTGFRCRCGELFCAEHRYSDRHDCSYDYKGVGRETIARENPVVKAAKIVRI